MKKLKVFLMVCLVSAGTAFAQNSRTCKECGMDMPDTSQSRVAVDYADGSSVGLCSMHCAADDINANKGKQVSAVRVEDYATHTMIDARTAVWVLGGRKTGGMNATPKWAFSNNADAQKFVQENGGRIASYDEIMLNSGAENAAPGGHSMGGMSGMAGCDMGAGSQMIYAPAFADDVYHTHPAGMWMAGYKFMHTTQLGLRDGTKNVDVSRVSPEGTLPYGYMMTPTRMQMDMLMLMAMYGVTDRLTVMGMSNYQAMSMSMLMNMGMGNKKDAPMVSAGFGDTEVRGIYKIDEKFNGSLGLSIPTGSIQQRFASMSRIFRSPYDMQLGSGSFDLKPAVTYNDLSGNKLWNWGGQAVYTYHTADNKYNYRLGDSYKVTGWFQRAFGPAAGWVRAAYSDTQRIHGRDKGIDLVLRSNALKGASMPDADPKNYGGKRLDAFLGGSYGKGPFSVGVEGGIPLYQNLNGLQLSNNWYLTTAFQVMF